MAKKSIIQRQLKRIKLVKKFRKQIIIYKKLISNPSTDAAVKWSTRRKLQKLPRDSSATRLRNRCWKTGRPRGVWSKFGLSRIKLREAAMKGEIPGLQKSSW